MVKELKLRRKAMPVGCALRNPKRRLLTSDTNWSKRRATCLCCDGRSGEDERLKKVVAKRQLAQSKARSNRSKTSVTAEEHQLAKSFGVQQRMERANPVKQRQALERQ